MLLDINGRDFYARIIIVLFLILYVCMYGADVYIFFIFLCYNMVNWLYARRIVHTVSNIVDTFSSIL